MEELLIEFSEKIMTELSGKLCRIPRRVPARSLFEKNLVKFWKEFWKYCQSNFYLMDKFPNQQFWETLEGTYGRLLRGIPELKFKMVTTTKLLK